MLRYTDITGRHVDKVKTAVDRLRVFEPADGYYLAFSGGKDSCCIKELANIAGVKYDAHYNVTTVDPPELVWFIRQYHPDVIFDRPELPMRKLIVKKLMPPTRAVRYCCDVLKEHGGDGRVVVTGVRWAESPRRKNAHGIARVGRKKLMNDNEDSRRMVEQCYTRQKTLVNPIVDWSDEDVWEFINERKLPYCSLYNEGFKRIGCVGCPMNTKAGEQLERWPQYKKLYLKAFAEMLEARRNKGMLTDWKSPEQVMDWWLGNTGEKVDKNQTTMGLEEELQ